MDEMLNEEEIGKSVKYDASDIQVLEGLEPVRKRPGMYIGSTDEHGLHHLVTEVVDNSIDEALAGYCTKIEVVINFDGSCSVIDNGRGIPTGIIPKENKSAVEVVLTKLHAGGKFGGEGYKISGGLHGVGVSCVNALSKYMRADVYQNGQHYKIEFSRGKVISPLEIIGKTDKPGTTITFMPDDEIFETTVFNFDTMKNRFREIAFLNKGLVISLEDKREGQERKEVFEFKGGIVEFVDYLNKNRETLLSAPVYFNKFNKKDGEVDNEVEVCFQFNEGYSEIINAYANNINTEEGGTHLDGFKAGTRDDVFLNDARVLDQETDVAIRRSVNAETVFRPFMNDLFRRNQQQMLNVRRSVRRVVAGNKLDVLSLKKNLLAEGDGGIEISLRRRSISLLLRCRRRIRLGSVPRLISRLRIILIIRSISRLVIRRRRAGA